MPSALEALSPLDGRYASHIKALAPVFSERGLMKKRLMVEIEYLIALGDEKGVHEIAPFDETQKKVLRSLYQNFSLKDAEEIKRIENTTNHDVKAIEYFIKEGLRKPPLSPLLRRGVGVGSIASGNTPRPLRGHPSQEGKILEFVHFALTSEDVNNLAYSLMWRDGQKIYIQSLKKFLNELKKLAKTYKNLAMLSLTHGQAASPTTLGKEMAVFYFRIKRKLSELERMPLTGKFSGTVGNWHTHAIAYPNVSWTNFSEQFVNSLGFTFNPLTTQIESHDTVAQSYDTVKRINTILINFCQDMWLYVSRGIFKQISRKGEVGSSTMPHKVNPIKFENAESNASLAVTLFEHLSRSLPVSRMQRDLRDSTLVRNQGMALGYSQLAVVNASAGLARIMPDKAALTSELDMHWELLAEPIQTILRKVGFPQPYETLKKLTRGKTVTKESVLRFINGLDIPREERRKLLKLTPQNYTGIASKLVDKYITENQKSKVKSQN